jgi:NhaP-type Na+/H+ or K+/H+ antiporter
MSGVMVLELLGKIMLGFFVGLLCGLVPLIYGFLTGHKITALAGCLVSALTGALFSALGRSPFIAVVVAMIFILFHIANTKRLAHEEHENNESEHISDDD